MIQTGLNLNHLHHDPGLLNDALSVPLVYLGASLYGFNFHQSCQRFFFIDVNDRHPWAIFVILKF